MVEGRSVVIAGFAPNSRDLANHEPPEVEVWGMNEAYTFLTRQADRWYQLHQPDNWNGAVTMGRDPAHVQWLQECGIPVYLLEAYDHIPTARRFPYEELRAEFGDYFTSTPAYMLAHAIYEGVDEVKIYGIDFSTTKEYVLQRACLEYYLGIARGRGIKITLPSSCPLLYGPAYGRRDSQNLRRMAQERLDQLKDQFFQMMSEVQGLVGRRKEAQDWAGAVSDDESRQNAQRRVSLVNQELQSRIGDLNLTIGMLRDAQHWASTLGVTDLTPAKLPNVHLPGATLRINPETYEPQTVATQEDNRADAVTATAGIVQ